jgi:hypothetical protein
MCLSIDKSKNIGEEAVMTYLKVLSRNFSGIDNEKHEKPS